MANQTAHKEWITVSEAARRLAMSTNHLRRLIQTGALPPGIAFRPIPGGHYRIDPEALDEWVRNGCFTVGPDQAAAGS